MRPQQLPQFLWGYLADGHYGRSSSPQQPDQRMHTVRCQNQSTRQNSSGQGPKNKEKYLRTYANRNTPSAYPMKTYANPPRSIDRPWPNAGLLESRAFLCHLSCNDIICKVISQQLQARLPPNRKDQSYPRRDSSESSKTISESFFRPDFHRRKLGVRRLGLDAPGPRHKKSLYPVAEQLATKRNDVNGPHNLCKPDVKIIPTITLTSGLQTQPHSKPYISSFDNLLKLYPNKLPKNTHLPRFECS